VAATSGIGRLKAGQQKDGIVADKKVHSVASSESSSRDLKRMIIVFPSLQHTSQRV